MQWYKRDIPDCLRALNTSVRGLSNEEAYRRLAEFGPNQLEEVKKTSPIGIFIRQFKNLLIAILLIAVTASFIIGETLDAIVISIIVFFVAILGFIQEFRAEKALDALKALTAPKARVLRDGRIIEILAKEVVPGDILVLETGDKIPADARLIEAVELKVDEAPLTGESVPVEKNVAPIDKDVAIGDQRNMVFSATTIIYGRGKAVVTSTGMNSEFGKIAKMLQEIEEPKTPLQERLDYVGKWLGIGVIIVVAIVASLEIFIRGEPPFEMFIWSIALAVAAVPEALPGVVTGALAIGVQRMSKKNAIVRRLPAVETLGATTVICSDKTGTLTKNEMVVRELYVDRKTIRVTGEGFEPEGSFLRDSKEVEPDDTLKLLLRIGALCNNSNLIKKDGYKIEGDPTEGALLVSSAKAGIFREREEEKFPRIWELPFSSERKLMTTIHRTSEGKIIAYVKGAPEAILNLSSHIYESGDVKALTERARSRILEKNEEMASRALRVLAMAYRELPEAIEYSPESVEKNLVFVGLQGMIDAPREEAIKAIEVTKSAGIKTIMITGDNKTTAIAVAKEMGILDNGKVITGAELESMSDDELDRNIKDITVCARVSPSHKIRIVQALKNNGHIVAMTGDGVNDAPALKKADIGIAMGITGTDVTKEASDIVLVDDNFATIIAAIEEGRVIYNNIKKYILFLLSCNIGEILAMFFAGLLDWPLPLLAIHILYVNLATDGFPAIALGVDPPEPDVMRRPPRDPKESLFKKIKASIGIMSIYISIAILLVFYWALQRTNLDITRTIVFASLIMIELFNAYNCRSIEHSIFKIGPLKNKWLNIAVIWEFILLNIIIFVAFFNPLLHTAPISLTQYAVVFSIGFSIIFFIELWKKVVQHQVRA